MIALVLVPLGLAVMATVSLIRGYRADSVTDTSWNQAVDNARGGM